MPREFISSTIYVVRPGDTLGAIAAANGLTVARIVAANPGLLSNPDLIAVGLQILLPGELDPPAPPPPPPAGVVPEEYVIASGDTLSAIASRWGCTVQAIAEINGIANPSLIDVGQRIRRPVAVALGSASSFGGVAHPQTPGVAGLRFMRMPFGGRDNITGGYKEDYGAHLHRGIDLGRVPVGTPIVAPAPGVAAVHRPGDGWGDGSFGVCVVLEHTGTGWWSIYAHMEGTDCATGQQVQAGDVIGRVGFTGTVDPPGPAGAHCHWQLSTDPSFPPVMETTADPMRFLA